MLSIERGDLVLPHASSASPEYEPSFTALIPAPAFITRVCFFFSSVIIVNEENSNSVLDFTSLRLYSVKEKVFEEQKTRNLYLHRDLIVILSRRHHTRVRNSTRGTETSQFQSKMFLNLHFSFIYFFLSYQKLYQPLG